MHCLKPWGTPKSPSGLVEAVPRHVKQLHDMGCAMAAIAIVTGAPYRDVIRRAFPNGASRSSTRGRPLNLGVTPYQMVKIIKSYGIRSRVTYRRRNLKTTSILLFDWFPPEDHVIGHHAVVWSPHQARILDPAFATDLGLEFYVNRWVESGRIAIELEEG